MALSEESAVNQEKRRKKKGERAQGRKKKFMLADYFPFFLEFFFSPSLHYFSSVHCEASLLNEYVYMRVCVCVCALKEGCTL